MTAYYNEFDPFAAAWLQKLIAAGHIAPGVVDTRDLWDVTPDDLRGFTQVHLCAGIGVWSYALRHAGWSDDRPIWSASFPCQPFSAAGKGLGFADERHLWPAGLHLIEQCDPTIVVGEQVASKDGLAWLDLVRADVERTGRSFAAADLCAAGVGAPHIRQRSFWVANRTEPRRGGRPASQSGRLCNAVGLADTDGKDSRTRLCDSESSEYGSAVITSGGGDGDVANALPTGRAEGRTSPGHGSIAGRGQFDGLANRSSQGLEGGDARSMGLECSTTERDGRREFADQPSTGPTNGFWRDADWLYCRDGKWRPVESGTFPLAHGSTNRVGRLRGYGNAIVAPVAETFIRAMMDSI